MRHVRRVREAERKRDEKRERKFAASPQAGVYQLRDAVSASLNCFNPFTGERIKPRGTRDVNYSL